VLFLLLFYVFLAFLSGGEAVSDEAVTVVSFAGDIKILSGAESKDVVCKPEMYLSEGDRIISGEEAYIEIAYDRSRNNVVKIKEDSEAVIKLEGADKVDLIKGEAFVVLRDLEKGETFRVSTPDAVCRARGTGWVIKVADNITKISVFDGLVSVRGINKDGSVMEEELRIEKGYSVETEKFNRPGKISMITKNKLIKLSREVR